MITYAALLQSACEQLEAQHVDEARLDAELLLAAARGLSRAMLLAHLDDIPDPATTQRFSAAVQRRSQHEPVAYILGHQEFYGLDLLVDRRVLIPRPETELLVDKALAWLADHGRGTAGGTVVDVGTGSGAIAIALAVHLTSSGSDPALPYSIIAVDISPDALAVAGANAERHGVAGSIRLVQSDLLENVAGPADLIVANLPYVARGEWGDIAPGIAHFEPQFALDGGVGGLALFRRLFAQAPSQLAPRGALMLEIGWMQAAAVRALAASAFPDAVVEVVADDAGLDRLVVVSP